MTGLEPRGIQYKILKIPNNNLHKVEIKIALLWLCGYKDNADLRKSKYLACFFNHQAALGFAADGE